MKIKMILTSFVTLSLCTAIYAQENYSDETKNQNNKQIQQQVTDEELYMYDYFTCDEIEKGNIEFVKKVILKKLFYDQATILECAVSSNQIDLLEFLINNNFDLNIKDKSNGLTALLYATVLGKTDMVKWLIDHNANLDIPFDSNYTALILAIENKNTEISKLLIENKANLDIQDTKRGYTALMLAIENKNTEISKLLIENEANLDIQDTQRGYTALMLAIEYNNIDIVQLLVNKGANLDIKNNNGQTAFEVNKMYKNETITKILRDTKLEKIKELVKEQILEAIVKEGQIAK